MEAEEARKIYRFRFHIGYLTRRVTWQKTFSHFLLVEAEAIGVEAEAESEAVEK